MINLLPPKQKEENLAEENLRLIFVLGITSAALLFSLILILFSVKVITGSQAESQKIILEQKENELEALSFHEMEKEIRDYNLLLSELDSFYKRNYSLTEILEKIYQTMPPGSSLNNFNFNLSKSQISFSGFCLTRNSLLKLKENLEKEEIFEEIYFPSSNWVKPIEIDFSVDLKLNPARKPTPSNGVKK